MAVRQAVSREGTNPYDSGNLAHHTPQLSFFKEDAKSVYRL